MASTRKLPSGKWQGIAHHKATGARSTQAFPLKRQAEEWAKNIEAIWSTAGHFDPRGGEIRFAEWVEVWRDARVVERTTTNKNESHLRVHVLPQWGKHKLAGIERLQVGKWIKTMQAAGTGAATIEGSVRLLSSILAAAVEAGRIHANPASKQRVPKAEQSAPRYFTREQADAIVAEMPGAWAIAVELDMITGLRIGELLGLRVAAVDWVGGQMHVHGVMTRHGWRSYPKSTKSRRVVPIPDHLLDALAPLVVGRPADAPVFAGTGDKPITDVNFRNRIWQPALDRAGLCPTHLEGVTFNARRMAAQAVARAELAPITKACEACTPVPDDTPHAMRHTAASWLVMDGVDLYRVQELLGHESIRTTQRYAHLAPSAHDKIRESWRRRAQAEDADR